MSAAQWGTIFYYLINSVLSFKDLYAILREAIDRRGQADILASSKYPSNSNRHKPVISPDIAHARATAINRHKLSSVSTRTTVFSSEVSQNRKLLISLSAAKLEQELILNEKRSLITSRSALESSRTGSKDDIIRLHQVCTSSFIKRQVTFVTVS